MRDSGRRSQAGKGMEETVAQPQLVMGWMEQSSSSAVAGWHQSSEASVPLQLEAVQSASQGEKGERKHTGSR